MKKKQFINEVRQFQKIAGILKEGGEDHKMKQAIAFGLDSGDSLYNHLDHIAKVYPEYVEKIKEYNDMEQEIYDRAMSDGLRRIANELDAGVSLINLIGEISKAYPEYVERIKQYNEMEQEIYDRAQSESM